MKNIILSTLALMVLSACSCLNPEYNNANPSAGLDSKSERGIPTVYRDSFGNKTTVKPKRALQE